MCSNLPQWLAEGKRHVLLLRGETSRHNDSRMLWNHRISGKESGRLCAGGQGSARKKVRIVESLVVGGTGTVISVVTRATR